MIVRFDPAARADLHAAIRYYAHENRELAVAFVSQIAKSVALIRSNPLIGQRYARVYRRVILTRFPYVLIYRIDRKRDVRIVAVGHQSRRADFWRNRVEEAAAVYNFAA